MNRFLSRILPTHWSLLLLAGIYLLTRNPYASFGDSLGMLYHASLGFDWATNATSHFLYVNLCALSLKLLPFLDQVLVLSLISWIFALLSLHRFGQLLKLTGCKEEMAAILMLIVGLGFTWWRQAVMIEVYTLSCWVGLSVVHALVRDELHQEKHLQAAWRIGLWWGLALLTHIQFLLLAPVVSWHVWRRRKAGFGAGIGALALAILVSSPLWMLPLLLDTHTLKAVLFDQGYQDQVLHTNLASLAKGSLRSLGYLLYNFHLWTLPLGWGLWKSWKRDRYWLWLAMLGGGPLWVFAMRYDVTDNYVFFLFPYFLLWLAAGAGFKDQGTGCREQGARCRVQGTQPSAVPLWRGRRGRNQGTGNKVLGAGSREQGSSPLAGKGRRVREGGWGMTIDQGTRIRVPLLENRSVSIYLALVAPLLLAPLVYGTAWKVAEQVPQVQAFAEPKAYKGGVRYYLWPGQAYSPDPLQLAKAIYLEEQSPNPDFDRYPIAIAYLKSRNLLPPQKDSLEEK